MAENRAACHTAFQSQYIPPPQSPSAECHIPAAVNSRFAAAIANNAARLPVGPFCWIIGSENGQNGRFAGQ